METNTAFKLLIKNTKFILFILFAQISIFSNAQNKETTFFSDYQTDKTYGGTNSESRNKVTISFSDPKSLTKVGTDFEKLPKGYVTIKYADLNQIKQQIVFLGKHEKTGADIYAIQTNDIGYDIIYVMKAIQKFHGKSYSYMFLLGKTDENNIGGMPKYYTRFHCNLKKQ